jgi:hypothetical protein
MRAAQSTCPCTKWPPRPVGRQRPFEIDLAAGTQRFQIRPLKSFFEKIEAQLAISAGGSGETATVYRHAIADLNFPRDTGGGDLQLPGIPIRPDCEGAANFFDQAGEHRVGRFRAAEQLTRTISNRNFPLS